jgi:hypothetical protein
MDNAMLVPRRLNQLSGNNFEAKATVSPHSTNIKSKKPFGIFPGAQLYCLV